MGLTLLAFVAGLALIIKGGDLFVASSVRIAELLRVPRLLIGSTLVSLATTSPELVVSATASLRGEPGLAIGNAVGSSIANIGLVIGTVAVLRPVAIRPREIKTPLWIMSGLGVLLFLITLDLRLGWRRGLLLLLLAIGYLIFDSWRHIIAPGRAETEEVEGRNQQILKPRRFLDSRPGAFVTFTGGALMVILGSWLLVDSAIVIAEAAGVPPIILGLTVVAVGTSLPEYVTAISSARKGVSDLSVGNVLGANILNLGLIVGVSAILHEVAMSRVTQMYNFPVMLLVMGLLVVSLLRERQLSRAAGWRLLGLYALYVAGLGLMATGDYVSIAE